MLRAGFGGHVEFKGLHSLVTWAAALPTRADHASSATAEARVEDGSHMVISVIWWKRGNVAQKRIVIVVSERLLAVSGMSMLQVANSNEVARTSMTPRKKKNPSCRWQK